MKICKKCKNNLKGRRKVLTDTGEYLCLNCHSSKLEKTGQGSTVPAKDTIMGRQAMKIARPSPSKNQPAIPKFIPTPIVIVNKKDDAERMTSKSGKKKNVVVVPPSTEINAV